MRKFLISFLLAALIMIPTEIYAQETIPHSFSAGDTISADMFNEILEKIKYVTYGFSSPSELVGIWSCSSTDSNIGTSDCQTNFSLDSSGFTRSKTFVATFVDDPCCLLLDS